MQTIRFESVDTEYNPGHAESFSTKPRKEVNRIMNFNLLDIVGVRWVEGGVSYICIMYTFEDTRIITNVTHIPLLHE